MGSRLLSCVACGPFHQRTGGILDAFPLDSSVKGIAFSGVERDINGEHKVSYHGFPVYHGRAVVSLVCVTFFLASGDLSYLGIR